jgi:hypothetical protein
LPTRLFLWNTDFTFLWNEHLHPCGAAGLRFVHWLPAGAIESDSPDDPVSMVEVFEVCDPDLRELPVVEPKRPDVVGR